MENIKLKESLFFPQVVFNTKEEIIDYLADNLAQQGIVKEGYKEALITREATYPTGLPSSSPRIAIPHANAELVNQTTLAVATLKKPVVFQNMGNVKENLNISIVIMLVIAEPHSQVKMLQKIINIVGDENLRNQIYNSKSRQQLFSLIKKAIV